MMVKMKNPKVTTTLFTVIAANFLIPFVQPPIEISAREIFDNVPIVNKTVNNYRQFYNLSSVSSTSSSGSVDLFESTTSIQINSVPTKDDIFSVGDSFASKSGSSSAAIEINKFFPADSDAVSNIDQPTLDQKFKDLSEVVLNLNVKPKQLTDSQKDLVILNADYNATASTTLNVYAESSSPSFVSSFENVLFNKKYISR